ncbi:MAG: ABC transporter ATP-binding protein [Saprospiraceae bacterium]|nr:ABC transporter ATP-binding protein [Saprospiraceae bacterium]
MATISIQCQHIKKSYTLKKNKIIALDDINLEVYKSEIFGLIGPDGAGKTSLIRILASLILPDSGSAKVEECDVIHDFEKLRTKIGYMPGRFSLYQDLTVQENLEFFASVFNTTVQDNYHLINDIYKQIEVFKFRTAGALSGGMKQKLALCCALIHSPSILFLDEPTTGVDAVSRIEFWEMLTELKRKGMTIFVSTPYMDEASLCDRIALMQSGKILSVSSPSQVKQQYSGTLWSLQSIHMYHLMQALKKWSRVDSAFSFGESIHVGISEQNISEIEIKNYLLQNGISEINIQRIEPTVEDCFMQLMDKN